jgi:hypothetical protein
MGFEKLILLKTTTFLGLFFLFLLRGQEIIAANIGAIENFANLG